ncbi:MAG: fimbrial protein [Segatella copri]|nr:fimbrial protein [Segatella copri]
MRRFHIYIGFIVWLLTSLFAVSCNDELEGNGYSFNSSSNLHVLVPTVLSANGTRTDDASGLPTYNATVDECQINDLTLYAFPVENEGKLLVETLPAPLATMMVEQHVANYQLNIEPGTYHIYVVANMNKVLSGKTIKTEDDLKKIVLGYGVGTEPGMPVSTNIPMIYEPKDVNGNIINTKIEKSGDKYTEVAANLKFTCVKVKLNLIMDPTASDNLYDKSYSITDIAAQKLTPSTHLLWDGKFTQTDVTSEYAKGIDTPLYNSTPTGDASKGCYYQKGEYEINEANKDVANEDVVKIADAKNNGTTTPANPKQWLFQGTYYLPERYISNAEEQSELKINGIVNNSNKNQYTIKLGHKQNASDALPTFPRGTYYEITGKLKSYGDMDLDCDVKVDDWKTVEINADFYHTTLWVNKTEANVSSTKSDTISYTSSQTDVTFGCIDSKIVGGKDEKVIILTKRDGNNIIFSINPNIPINEFPKNSAGKREGTARVYLQANNIKKYIKVHYDVTPYFKVSPKNVVIYWGKDPDDKQVLEKHFVVETNLGGLKAFQNINGTLTEKTSGSTAQVGDAPSRLKISYDNTPDDADGKYLMKVQETVNPVTTTVYNFTLKPLNQISGDEIAAQEVTVTVKPEFGPYRIYMRAINNFCSWDGKPATDEDLKVILKEQKKEYTGSYESYNDTNNFNWYDGWYWERKEGDKYYGDETPHNDRHYMYMYTQIGESSGASTSQKAWIFSESYPGNQMDYDANNAGWYYNIMKTDAPVKSWQHNASGPKTIKPGQTLVMFGNGENSSNGGCTPHRFPHHMDPGIPLFNYEDHEGWYLYDPTCIPYYRVYDDKPTIVNVDYVIYTRSKITSWRIDFGCRGIDNDKKKGPYTLCCSSDTFKEHHTDVGNGWYRTVLSLKAPKGEYEKAIKICFNDSKDGPMLFGGDSYECKYDATKGYQIFGYYDGSSWHEGKPF